MGKRKKGAASAPQGKKAGGKGVGGRRSTYTAELGLTICEWVARGHSLNAFCRLPKAPAKETVQRWLRSEEEFRVQYARAREEQADAFVDEIIDIAHEEEDVNRARLKIDTRKWAAARLAPKKYGDRLESVLKGHDGGTVKIEVLEPKLPPKDACLAWGAKYLNGGAAKHDQAG